MIFFRFVAFIFKYALFANSNYLYNFISIHFHEMHLRNIPYYYYYRNKLYFLMKKQEIWLHNMLEKILEHKLIELV